MAAKRRKPEPFKAASAVKAAARKKIGMPPPVQVDASNKKRRGKSPKHRPTLGKLLAEE
jgi:hypothetical protein